MEAISNLREPGGSNKTSIAAYIEVTELITFLVRLMKTYSVYVHALKLISIRLDPSYIC